MVFLMVFDVICCSFVSRPSLSKLYSVLETNPLVFDILVSILLTLVTNLSHRVFLTISLSTTLISLFKSSEKLLVCLHQIYLLQILGQLNQILLLNQMYQRLLLFLNQLCLINRQIKSTFYIYTRMRIWFRKILTHLDTCLFYQSSY